jgi:MtN3 and saliva related transmembrane protein
VSWPIRRIQPSAGCSDATDASDETDTGDDLFLQIEHVIHYLGYFAGVLTVASFLPQVVRAWRTKQTRDLSLAMFALLITSGSLWMLYALANRDWPVLATNGGMVALNAALAAAKLRYR